MGTANGNPNPYADELSDGSDVRANTEAHASAYADVDRATGRFAYTVTKEMTKLFALLVILFSAVSAFAQVTPTATPTAAFDFPNAPTQEQTVSGPLGQTLVWDGKKWVAQGTPASGAFLPLTGGTLTGPLVGTLITMGNGSTLGTTTISSLTVSGTTNAAAIVASGTVSAPTLTSTGTLNANNAVVSGIMNFGTAGALYFNGTPMGGSCTAGNAVTLISNRGVPTCSPFTTGGPWLPVNNPTYTGTLTGPNEVNTGGTNSLTWQFPNEGLGASFGDGYGNTSESSFLIGQSMSYTGGVPNSWTLGGTTQYGPTAASSIQMTGAATVITGDTGLTTGQAFLPTMLFSISPVAYPPNNFMGNAAIPVGATFNNLPVGVTGNLNGDLNFTVTNTNTGANAGANFWGTNGTDWIGWSISGSGYTPAPGPRTAILWTSAPNNLVIQSDNSPIHLVSQGSTLGSFYRTSDGHFQGLVLPGYDGFGINSNGGAPALSIGNGYIGGETWSNLDFSGASYFDAAAGNWKADGGAGGGASLFQILTAGTFRFFGTGAIAGGSVITWNPVLTGNMAGIQVTHIENEQNYGVISCTNCTAIANGARDTDGFVQVSGTWPIILYFAKPFTGSAVCTGNTLATPPNEGVVSFSQNTTTTMQIYCNLLGGAACSSQTGWISYHCFGYGA